jgi:hypothetical protein
MVKDLFLKIQMQIGLVVVENHFQFKVEKSK